MGQQRCDGNGWPETCRMLVSAAPPIQGNNQLMWTVWGGVVWSSSYDWPPKSTTMTTMTKQRCRSIVNNDGNDSDGGDSDGNGDGDSNGVDADAAANGDDVDDDNSGILRTAIGQRQLDNNYGTTMM